MNPGISFTPKQLRRAALIQEKIAQLQDELEHLLGALLLRSDVAPSPKRRRRPRFTEEARAKMSKSQQERWARVHALQKIERGP